MAARNRYLLISALLVILVAFLAACGGGSAEPSEAGDDTAQSRRAAVPTMPAAQFGSTAAEIDLTKVAESASEDDEGPDRAAGESAYMRLCAECHGDDGAGIADTGSAVTGLNLDAAAMETLLRTGGGFGNEHIFGPDKISEDGIVALAAYMETLGE